ncbi:MAG: Panacea domain-containing protein [Mangrovibacterium sp.]
MIKFKFNKEKTIAALLFIAKHLKRADLHKISKILYYADQKHLVKYGTPITGDFYNAMNYGPVPSKTYDILKAVRGDSFFQTDEFNKYFYVDNSYIVTALVDPDFDEFSESDIECLTESLNENGHLGFHELVKKSHGKAYEKTTKNSTIPIDEIAKEGGANNEMLKYINAIAENSNVFC